MTASRPNNEVIFHAARDIPDPDRRRAYVRQACGGDETRIAHVEALLAAAVAPDTLLDRPAWSDPVATIDQPAAESTGAVIGPYKLIEPIGEGGMGTVWMAQQAAPVKRLVAVKLIKAGMDSRQVIARFEAERQALALMDHPNIARVLDAGASPAGRPYFAMELVKGIPITRYCDERSMSVRERLELFVPVCQAVQHAHQKGIIHRDLKPTNVLVGLYDPGAPGVPKVIDFGVAKAIGPKLTEATLITGFGTVIGTPEYMSPEQAQLDNLDIDTRSDIYALGVLLYELLTGTTPFTKEDLEKSGMLEMLRVIREQEPAKPSTKLNTAEGLQTLASNRGTEPAKLTKLVRGELDWIVMKALEKDRNRRYATASSLAMDLRRYLDDEPVQACPPSTGYRLRKFVRRNRRPVAVILFVALALVVAMVGTTVGLVRAEQARRTADEERTIAQAVNDFLQDLLGQVDLENQPGGGGADAPRDPDIKVRTVLDRAAKTLEARFANQPRVEAAIRLTIGQAYRALGLYKEAQLHAERSVELCNAHLGADHPDTLTSKAALVYVYYYHGFYERGEALCQQVLEKRMTTLGPDHPDTLKTQHYMALIYNVQGKFELAKRLWQELVQKQEARLGAHDPTILWSKCNLANIHLLHRRYDLAEAECIELIKAFESEWGEDHLGVLASKMELALVYKEQREYNRAETLLREVLERRITLQGSVHLETLYCKCQLARVYCDQRKYDQAVPLLEEAVAAGKANWGEDHHYTWDFMMRLAYAYRDSGKPTQALPLIEQVLTKREKLEPDAWRTFDAKSMLGEALLGQKKYSEAERLLVQGYDGMKQREAKISPEMKVRVTEALERLVQLYDAWGKPAEAAKWRRELEAQKWTAGTPATPKEE